MIYCLSGVYRRVQIPDHDRTAKLRVHSVGVNYCKNYTNDKWTAYNIYSNSRINSTNINTFVLL